MKSAKSQALEMSPKWTLPLYKKGKQKKTCLNIPRTTERRPNHIPRMHLSLLTPQPQPGGSERGQMTATNQEATGHNKQLCLHKICALITCSGSTFLHGFQDELDGDFFFFILLLWSQSKMKLLLSGVARQRYCSSAHEPLNTINYIQSLNCVELICTSIVVVIFFVKEVGGEPQLPPPKPENDSMTSKNRQMVNLANCASWLHQIRDETLWEFMAC